MTFATSKLKIFESKSKWCFFKTILRKKKILWIDEDNEIQNDHLLHQQDPILREKNRYNIHAFVAFSFRCLGFFEGKYGAACYQKSAWHLQQFAHPGETWIKPFLMKVWTLSKSHFVGLKSKLSDFLAIYFLVYCKYIQYIYIYIYIYNI